MLTTRPIRTASLLPQRPAPRATAAGVLQALGFGFVLAAAVALVAALPGCAQPGRVAPGEPTQRYGDEIVAAGLKFRTGAPVVLWTDPGGYDAYRTEYRFVDFEDRRYDPEFRRLNGPQRYNLRDDALTEQEREIVRGGGWPIELLRDKVDQFVLHYDVCGTSRQCFNILHDHRGLSVHFMLDIDGTVYQTLDLKERAWHAGHANTRSIGIEIANIGAYPPGEPSPLDNWYAPDATGRPRVTLPGWMGDGGVSTPGFAAYPERPERVRGMIHGRALEMYDLTPEQYDSLVKLTAALCTIFPNIECDYPRDASGGLLTTVMPRDEWESYGGLIGHYHLTENKIDPGPAFQWERVVTEARDLMR